MSNTDTTSTPPPQQPKPGASIPQTANPEEEPTFFDRSEGIPGQLMPIDMLNDEQRREREQRDLTVEALATPGFGGVNLQPSYPSYQPVAYAGMPATMTSWDAESYIVDKAAVAAIPFGRAVSVKGASLTDGSQRSIVLGGTAAVFLGVTYRDITQQPNFVAQGDGYPAGWNAGVMTRGDIWVQVSSAIAVTDAVKFITATGVFDVAGTITLANARWMRGASGAGQLALLRLNHPSAV